MIFDAFERMMAFRYLRARRQEGFISVIAIFSFLGIMLGVAALIMTISVMNGFTTDLLGRIVGFGGHVTVEKAQGSIADFDAIDDKLRKLPGIVAARPVVEGQVLATAAGRSAAMVRGLRKSDLAGQSMIAHRLAPGDLERFNGDNILVGRGLAYALGVRPGDRVTLTTPNVQANSLALPRARSYEVAGLFTANIQEYDSSFIFMPLEAAQSLFNTPDAVTSVEVFVADPDNVQRYESEIEAALGDKLHLTTWQESNAALFGALQVERVIMFIILSLIILVAAFNIICSMIMLVKDKGQDIAILRTMGASRGMILRVFMLSGASIGVVGTLAGLVLGVAGATHLRDIQRLLEAATGPSTVSTALGFFSTVPARIDPLEIGLVLAMAFGLSFLATLYPSWRAARLDPVEALRYE
ncbi:MAG TPA: lipoprotein-releasing ABC transporter permease subunit [Stellaceae bacterium]|nr:lipoprotein-releasing ABC transporter permease subunit [Stellaceae bacterium]